MREDVFRVVTSVRQRKNSESPLRNSKIVYECLADRENSSSLSSLQVSVDETYNEGILKEEQAP